MKAILLAGGYATRLWPLTRSTPKPLLPLKRKRVASYIVDDLEEIAAIDEIIVSTNLRFKREFEKWKENEKYSTVRVEEEETLSEEGKLGTIGALSQFIQEIDEEGVLVVAGDNYFPFDFQNFIRYYREKNSTVIATYELENKRKAKKYGVLELSEDDRVTSFVEKPERPPASTVSVACYLFRPSHFRMIKKYLEEGNNPDEPGRFIEWLHKRKNVYGFRFTQKGFDIGTPASYLEAFEELTDESYVSEDTEIEPSVEIRDPVIIEEDVHASGKSVLGPYVHLQTGVRVGSSSISNSILFEESTVENSRISKSIVGKKAEIRGLELKDSVIGGYTRANSCSS